MASITYRSADVDGFKVASIARPALVGAPKLLLLHGFPSAGHMFRDLIPRLPTGFISSRPIFPASANPTCLRAKASATRSTISRDVIDRFTEVIGFDRFAIYVFDYGAPTGFRLALKHPERITAIISQNGNAYEEGLSDGWNPIQAYWKDAVAGQPRRAARLPRRPRRRVWQYTHGVPDPTTVSPDGHSLDNFYLARPGADEMQLDLFGDYKSNVALYPTFQDYFRTHKPPFLAVWGKNDPFFLPPRRRGIQARHSDAVVQFFDTGHFALETHAKEIADSIRAFLP